MFYESTQMFLQAALTKFFSWFDSSRVKIKNPESESVDWLRVTPFILLHVACLLVFVVGWSPVVLWVAFISYFIRMFAITAFYHRYFSHKSFRTSRVLQFLFGLLGATATQRGPIWWASHHRRHHRYSDTERDIHSPRKGFWWSHMGWFMSSKHFTTREQWVRDLNKFPELRFLDRFDIVIPVLYAVALWGFGKWLEISFPELGTTGWQMLTWGYFVSTIVLLHCTLFINSLSHVWGNQRYQTNDDSRNNGFLALITLGEGWHNNHHRYPMSVRQGFYWWEVDITYYLLRLLAAVGLIWDLKPVPREVREAHTAVAP